MANTDGITAISAPKTREFILAGQNVSGKWKLFVLYDNYIFILYFIALNTPEQNNNYCLQAIFQRVWIAVTANVVWRSL